MQLIESINSLKQFSALSFTTEEDIKLYNKKMICVSIGDIKRIVSIPTSGTTGEHKTLYFSENDLDTTADFFGNALRQIYDYGDSVLICFPYKNENSIGDIIHKGITKFNANSIKHGTIQNLKLAYEDLLKSDSVIGSPINILALSKFAKFKQFNKKLNGVLVSSDNVSAEIINLIQNNFNCDVYNHYGLTESAYGCAVECNYHTGMHVRENDIYLEIIDPETGGIVKDGNYGEIVITTFNRQAMPLIRYRTKDIGRVLQGKCNCGSNFKRIDFINGRIENNLPIIDLDKILFSIDYLIDYCCHINNNKVFFDLYFLENCDIDIMHKLQNIFPYYEIVIAKHVIDNYNLPKLYKTKRFI